MISALLLAAITLCQPAAVDAGLADVTRAWFVARRQLEDRAPRVSEETISEEQLATLQRRALGAWGRAARDPRLLRDGVRLRNLFRRCMDYSAIAGDGELHPWAEEAGVQVRVPLGYTPELAWPTLVAAYDAEAESEAAAAQRVVGLADPDWIIVMVDARRLASFVRPPMPQRLSTAAGIGLAASAVVWALGPPALGRAVWDVALEAAVGPPQKADARDLPRGLFSLLGGVQRRLHIDRDRIVLVCSNGAAQVGVRVVATAPDRFAGLVLWAPAGEPAGQLDNLGLVPILVVSDGVGAGAAAAHATLAGVAGATLALRTWPDDSGAVRFWVRAQRRELFRRRVAFVMEEDAVVDGFWLKIAAADFSNDRGERRAHIEATVDRSTNTINVTAQHVDEFTLLLSDALVDLDRAMVIEINGVQATLRRVRNVEFLLESVFQRFDPGYVFTTAITLAVPRRS